MTGRRTARGVVGLALVIAAVTAVGAGEVRVAQKDKSFSTAHVT